MIKILFKLTLLLYKIIASVKQYSLEENHLHNNPQVKMPSRMGYFHEMIIPHQEQWESPHAYSHHVRNQRKLAAASM